MPSSPDAYTQCLSEIRAHIHHARDHVAITANSTLIQLYWRIGRDIIERQGKEGWGSGVIDRLAADLRKEFADVRGLSARNLRNMRRFAETWRFDEIRQGTLAKLPWWHQLTLLEKLKGEDLRRWYAQAAVTHGWTRDLLVHQIETRLHERQGRAISNFASTMTLERATATSNALKDPYVLGFLDLAAEASERQLESELISRIQQFLIELGSGFAFMGRQYHIAIGEKDFYIDLLFYYTKLHCFVAIDLKIGEFIPEYTGKMSFYLSLIDEKVKTTEDHPSIGLILYRSKNGLVVEYSLRDSSKPIAVSEYTLLPAGLAAALPSPEEIEASISDHSLSDDPDEEALGWSR